jgi:hypothetical protein
MPTTINPELTTGIYVANCGVFKVQQSKESGRLYAKKLAGEKVWEYAAGAIYNLRPETKLTLEQAKEFGRRTGICVVCGAKLTNPVSVSEGIGPVCSGRI